MIRTLLAATALTLAATGFAHAQSATMLSSGYQMTVTDALASKLVGSPIYSTVAMNTGAANDAAAPAGATPASTSDNGAASSANGSAAPVRATDTNAQQIGTISDLVLTQDGKVAAVVVGIGGVLGLGQKSVAVAYSDVKWTIAQDGSVRGMLDTTADALKSAPDFQWPANGQPTKAGDNNNNGNSNANGNAADANGAMSTPAPASGDTAMSAAPAANNMAPAASATASVTDPQTFANEAGTSNMFEIQSSQLAVKQAAADNVKQFAQKMIDDHTKAGQDMMAAANSDGVKAPTALDSSQQQQLTQLQGLNGQSFDQAYIAMQVTAHDTAVSLFQSYAQSGKAGALKDFAAKTLPVLKMHQQMIHQIAGK